MYEFDENGNLFIKSIVFYRGTFNENKKCKDLSFDNQQISKMVYIGNNKRMGQSLNFQYNTPFPLGVEIIDNALIKNDFSDIEKLSLQIFNSFDKIDFETPPTMGQDSYTNYFINEENKINGKKTREIIFYNNDNVWKKEIDHYGKSFQFEDVDGFCMINVKELKGDLFTNKKPIDLWNIETNAIDLWIKQPKDLSYHGDYNCLPQ